MQNPVNGSDGNNRLTGTAQDDHLRGFDGDDVLEGGAGNDILDGGTGSNRLIGGTGDDLYRVRVGEQRIDERDGGGNDTLELSTNRLEFSRAGDDLIISDSVILKGHYLADNTSGRVETLRLNTGEEINLLSVQAGTEGNDTVLGTAGNDQLFGNRGNDILDGGAGDDILKGESGNDDYIWGPGKGSDTITDRSSSETDRVIITGDVAEDDISFSRQGVDLILTLPSGETLTIVNQFDPNFRSNAAVVDVLVFPDGHEVDLEFVDINSNAGLQGTERLDRIEGGSAGEVIRGLEGNDVLTGNGGADALLGGPGDDTYVWRAGDGFDVINEQAGGGFDSLAVIGGYSPADVVLGRTGDNLDVRFATGETISIRNHFAPDTILNRLEEITFGGANGNTIDLINIQIGDRQADILTGSQYGEELYGNGGNDTLRAGDGADRLVGGPGNDQLEGGDGDDVYMWRPGDGHDVIFENPSNDTNTIRLDATQSADDISYRRSGDDFVIEIGSNGSLTITDYYVDSSAGSRVETIIYGGPGAPTTTVQLSSVSVSNSGSGSTTGTSGDDTIVGGPGDDILRGGAGNDTYRFNFGDGNDVIDEEGAGGFDRIVLPDGLFAADIELFTSDGDITLQYSDTDSVTVRGFFADSSNQIEDFLSGDSLFQSFRGTVLIGSSTSGTSEGGNDSDAIYAGGGNDTLLGLNGNDLLKGGAGNDRIEGGFGRDVLIGGKGDDTLIGGNDNDTYIWAPGDGNDTLQDSGSGSFDNLRIGGGVTLNDLSFSGSGDDLVLTMPSGETITLTGYLISRATNGLDVIIFDDGQQFRPGEFLVGTSGNDTINGSNSDDYIIGGLGNDTLKGNFGVDTLEGGPGNDTLNGGSRNDIIKWGRGQGNDTIEPGSSFPDDSLVLTGGINLEDVSFRMSGDDFVITISQTSETLTIQDFVDRGAIRTVTFANGDVYSLGGGSNADLLPFRGTNSNDSSLVGNDLENRLEGLAGNDTLIGAGDDDELVGGTGNDVLEGGTGRDQYFFEAGFGQDTIRDTGGPDSIRMLGDFTTSDVTTRQSGDSIIIGFAGVTDTITLDGFFGPSGSSVTSVIFEDGSEFTLDTIRQQADETDGPDTVTYTHANVDVRAFDGDDVITLTGRGTNTVDAGPGNDTVTGGFGVDTLIGGTGNDILDGSFGDDVLEGNAGDDELTVTGGTARGGSGNDTYIWKRAGLIDEQGAGGFDVIEAQVNGDPDNFIYTRIGDDLTIKSSFFTILTIRNQFSADGASRVETLKLTDGREIDLSTLPTLVLGGSERSDTLQASSTSPELRGNGGDDTLNGSSGANVLVGGEGDDTLNGGAGADDLQGGNGFDDIDGGSGNDLLNGGTGNDFLSGGAGSDTYTWVPGDGNDTISDSGGNDVLRLAISASQEQLVYSRDGNDLLIGGLPTSRFSSSGNATITVENHFAPGNSNRLEQIEFANGNTVNLSTVSTSSGSTTGTASSDFLRGTDANETLDGGDGNDRLDGGGGNDTLRGGNGSDTYVWGPGSGNDRIEETDEGRSSDRVVLSSSLTRDDVSVEQSGLDMVLRLSTGETLTIVGQFDETKSIGVGTISGSGTGSLQFSPLDVRGGDGDDTLRAGTRRTTVDGQDGNDTLFGGSDRDTLRGGDGNDILDGNAGDDFLVGGPGNDVYRGETLWEDSISDRGGGQDRIELPEGITPDDVTFQRNSFTGLIIKIEGKGEIRLAGQFADDDSDKIETLRFADGTELSLENPTFSLHPNRNIGSLDGSERDETLIGSNGGNTLKGFGGNDRLEGLGGSDDLIGGDGDDVLIGGSGDDTYDPGLGHDTIEEQAGGGNDILKLQEGIRPTDLTLTRNGNDLSIFVSDQQSFTVVDHFVSGGQSAIEQIQFTDRDGARRIDIDDIPLSTSSASQSAAAHEAGYSVTQSVNVVTFAPIVDEAGLS